MSLLRQQDIEELLRASPPLIENFNVALLGTNRSPVRGASLDLSIGGIFLPGVADGELGGSDRGRSQLALASGETAVIRTAEVLRLPGNIAAIGFPPSTAVSLAGLLTTNPGHVDPGYWGALHLTVINMGREVFSLDHGDRIMRLMLFRLTAPEPAFTAAAASPISEELLAKLSPDFLNVGSRVDSAIEKASWRIQARNALIPVATAIVSALLGGVAAFALNYFSGVQQMKVDIATLQAKLNGLGSTLDLHAVDQRLNNIEARLPPVSSVPAPVGGTKP